MIKLSTASFWARVYDLTLDYQSESVLKLIAAKVWVLECFESLAEWEASGWLHFKVEIDITRPLLKGITIRVAGELVWLPLKLHRYGGVGVKPSVVYVDSPCFHGTGLSGVRVMSGSETSVHGNVDVLMLVTSAALKVTHLPLSASSRSHTSMFSISTVIPHASPSSPSCFSSSSMLTSSCLLSSRLTEPPSNQTSCAELPMSSSYTLESSFVASLCEPPVRFSLSTYTAPTPVRSPRLAPLIGSHATPLASIPDS
ncbi:hypothetical protein ACS0TY_017244 [Phlomoides rotata]